MSVESYAHKASKAVILHWLKEAEDNMGDVYAGCLDVAWFADDNGVHFWEEYPILPDLTGLNPCWGYLMGDCDTPIPTYDSLKNEGRPPAVILDIAIADAGYIRAGIEIVHKNPPSQAKLTFLKNARLTTLIVLPARWILGQIGRPRHIPREFRVWG